jgi:hypothetical protein
LNRSYYEELARASGAFYQNERVMPFIVLDAEEVEILEALVKERGADIAERILLNYSLLFAQRNDKDLPPNALQFKNFLVASNIKVANNKVIFKEFEHLHKQAVQYGFKRATRVLEIK